VLHPAKATIASTGFAVLTAKELPYSYIYAATTTDEFVSYLEKRATGAAYPAVTAKVFEDAPVLVPEATLLERFAEIANPCAETIASLRFRIENLRKTRDLLLPRLLSGQLSVEDAA
jgi:type I restriction enzyme S subunit